MSKMTIIEGNSNDKDQVRAYLVKGERGYSAYELYVQNGGTLTEEEWLDEFTNADNFYNKSETDNLLNNKANASDVYTKNETNNLLSEKANSSDVYDKTEVYTQTETDDLLNNKANASALSYYKLKGDFAVLEGTISVESNKVSGKEISLPNGFTSNNSFIIGFKWNEGYATKTILGNLIADGKEMTTNYMILAYGSSSKIDIRFYNPRSTKSTFNYELLLMKYKD